MGKFVIKKSVNSQYYFVLKAGNGETILTGETYLTKAGAQNGIASVRTNSQIDARFERKTSDWQYYFVLKAANNEPLGKSEMYTSASAMENGIASVRANAPDAPVEDLT